MRLEDVPTLGNITGASAVRRSVHAVLNFLQRISMSSPTYGDEYAATIRKFFLDCAKLATKVHKEGNKFAESYAFSDNRGDAVEPPADVEDAPEGGSTTDGEISPPEAPEDLTEAPADKE